MKLTNLILAMKSSMFLMCACIFCIIVVESCHKEDSFHCKSVNSLQDLYKKHAVGTQQFLFNSEYDNTITGLEGTRVTFSKQSFSKKNGQIVDGNVIVELKEIYKMNDMLYSGKPTTTTSIPLKSGGEIFLKARLHGSSEELIIRESTPIQILFPAEEPLDTMFEYAGYDSSGIFVWGQVQNPQTWLPIPATPTNNGYQLNTTSLNWINCDRPIFSEPWVKFTMNANDPPEEYSTDVYLFFPGNTMIHVYRLGITDFVNYFTPCNTDFTAVAIGFKNGQLYSSFIPITSGTVDYNISFSLTPTTEAILTQALEDLN